MLTEELLELSARLRSEFIDCARGLDDDLTTLATAEYFHTKGSTLVATRAANRLMTLVALFDPTLVTPTPQFFEVKEDLDFPDP